LARISDNQPRAWNWARKTSAI